MPGFSWTLNLTAHRMGGMDWNHKTSGVIAVAVSMVLLSGCGPDSGDGGGTSPAPTQSSVSTAPSPSVSAMSLQEYSATLTKALGPLQTALKDLAEARKYKGLPKRVAAAGSAAGEAGSALAAIQPPVEVTAEHGQLVAALSSFAGDLSSVGDEVDSRALCTGSAVRASLGDAGGTDDLRKALAAVVAKLPGDKPSLKLPADDLKAGSRLANGSFIRTGKRSGQAELAIDNGGSSDAVVTLSKGGKAAIAVYIRKGRKVTVRGVPDGTYTVYFTGGSGWDEDARGFARKCAFQKFEDKLPFETTSAGWRNWRISLSKVIGGNARTNDVDPDEFPDS